MNEQFELAIPDSKPQGKVEGYEFEPIKGFPHLNWKGKRPFNSTQYYPAQLKENHGSPVNGWMSRIYWGDNLQVMSHLLKEFRGDVDLIYIDPPFASETIFNKKIKLRGTEIKNDQSVFEEKQYTDLWVDDQYLQFIYERITLLRELLSPKGSIYIHVDVRVSSYIRLICDELFGKEHFRNWICWKCSPGHSDQAFYNNKQNHILFYSKTDSPIWNSQHSHYDSDYLEDHYQKQDPDGRKFEDDNLTAYGLNGGGYEYEWKGVTKLWRLPIESMQKLENEKLIYYTKNKVARFKRYLDKMPGMPVSDLWLDIPRLNSQALEKTDYPTQKPEALLARIIQCSSDRESIVLDAFMGSGTTLATAMKLGRRFIGADINLGAIQTSTKRLIGAASALQGSDQLDLEGKPVPPFTGFSVYNVNHYDVFRNPVQAKDLLIEALEIQPLPGNSLYDGEKDGRMVKIMPINSIATKADLNLLLTNFNYTEFQKRRDSAPNKPVESLLLVCMGHEPDLGPHLQKECHGFELDVEVVDILRDKSNLEFKRDSEACICIKGGLLLITSFYPMNLLQKLSIMKENVTNWKELTESVMVDWNYDGSVFEPTLVDIPPNPEMVMGSYPIPPEAGTIRVKITDLLSESLEMEVRYGKTT